MRRTLTKNVKIAVISIMALSAAMIAKAQDAKPLLEDKADALAESRYLRSIYKTDEAKDTTSPRKA